MIQKQNEFLVFLAFFQKCRLNMLCTVAFTMLSLITSLAHCTTLIMYSCFASMFLVGLILFSIVSLAFSLFSHVSLCHCVTSEGRKTCANSQRLWYLSQSSLCFCSLLYLIVHLAHFWHKCLSCFRLAL